MEMMKKIYETLTIMRHNSWMMPQMGYKYCSWVTFISSRRFHYENEWNLGRPRPSWRYVGWWMKTSSIPNQLDLGLQLQVDLSVDGIQVGLRDHATSTFSWPEMELNVKLLILLMLSVSTYIINFFCTSFWFLENYSALDAFNNFSILQTTVWHFTTSEDLPH